MYVGLAESYVLAPRYAGAPIRESDVKAEEAARRALALDTTIAEAHTTLGAVFADRYQWAEAESEFKRAIGLRPDYAAAHHWYATFILHVQERHDSALAELQRARDADPASPAIAINYAKTFRLEGAYDKAVAEYTAVLRRFPDAWLAHQHLGITYALMGDYQRAESELKTADAPPASAAMGTCGDCTGGRGAARRRKRVSPAFARGQNESSCRCTTSR